MIQTDKYVTKLPYGPSQEARKKAKEDTHRLYDLFKADLRSHLNDIVGVQMNDEQFAAIFKMAWESGHSEGYQTVVFHAEDLADLVREFVK